MQVGSRLGYFRQNQVGSVWIESSNMNKKLLNCLLQALFNAISQQIEQSLVY